jgi:mono/diheme cytochrome c family protein
MRPPIAVLLRRPSFYAALVAVLLAATVGQQYLAAHRPEPERARVLAQGREVYGRICHVCHGERMEGRALPNGAEAPPLVKPGFAFYFWILPSAMEGFLADLIGEGRRQMPSFAAALSPAERQAVAAFIHAANTGGARLP